MLIHLAPVTPLLVGTFILLAGNGVIGMLLPLRAAAEGWTPTTIGWMGTGYAVAFTAGCILVPRLVRSVGHVRVFSALSTAIAISMLGHALVIDPIAWIAIRAVAGFSLAGIYMVTESWLNERATNDIRGLVFSIYMIITMVGLMAGQFLMPLGDPTTPTLFMVAAILYGLALMPTALSPAASPAPLTQVSLDLRGLYRRSPAAAVGSFLSGVIAGNWNYLAPIYGHQIGLSTLSTATMLAAAMIGGALCQIPLGRLSDKMDRRQVMVGAGIFGAAISAGIVAVDPSTPWIVFLAIFFLGGVLFPIYSLNVAHANDHAEPHEFVNVAGGLLIINGGGVMFGPQFGGRLMDAVGPNGFIVAMGVTFVAYAGHAFWRTLRRQAVEAGERSGFQPASLPRQQTPQILELDPRSDDV